jgi:putative exporter of polyketide antibiotics
VVADVPTAKTIAWKSPSGWSYQVNASTKTSTEAPMTIAQLIDLARKVDAS